jgi:outer membrane protein insertion porin family
VITKKLLTSSVLMALCINTAFSWDSFRISSIRYEGLHSLNPDMFDFSMNVKPGQVITPEKSNKLLQALYGTGYFEKVHLDRKGNVLIVDVKERPTIAKVTLKGNKLIKSKDLNKVLTSAGLVVGNSFNPMLSKQIQLSLVQEYYNQGKYAAIIKIKQKKISRNRVNVIIDISEGLTAKIKNILIIGNKHFTDKQLIKKLPISMPSIVAFFTNSDRFDQNNLQKALQTLSDFYMDRGYADFRVLSTESAITPDHKFFYLTINISEGKKYKFGTYQLVGDTIVPKAKLKELVKVKPGDVFSRKVLLNSVSAIKNKIADKGYAFTNVQPVPEVDSVKGIINFKFYIDVGRKVTIRHINFTGNTMTNEIVFRRDMRFVEDSIYNKSSLKKSTMKLQQHPFVSSANYDLAPVLGSNNQVDVNYKLKERSANGVKFSVGYSDLDKVFVGASLDMPNVFGTGNAFSIGTQLSRPEQSLNMSYTQPYFTLNGVSETISAYMQREDNSRRQNWIGYSLDSYGFDLVYGFPINDTDTFSFGGGYSFNHLFPPGGDYKSLTVENFLKENGGKDRFNGYILNLGWSRNTLNSAYFPTKGVNNSLTAKGTVPGSTLTWYQTSLSSSWYHPITSFFTLNLRGQVKYGDGYGKTHHFPFFRNYYAGGWGTIRGYEDSDLGPHDSLCTKVNASGTGCTGSDPAVKGNAIGGNLLVSASANVFFPVPFATDNDNMRFSLFLDAGNVYDTYNLSYAYEDNSPKHPTFGNLRYSAGLAFQWLSPVGAIGFSLAEPIRKKSGDGTQIFQFTMGQFF